MALTSAVRGRKQRSRCERQIARRTHQRSCPDSQL